MLSCTCTPRPRAALRHAAVCGVALAAALAAGCASKGDLEKVQQLDQVQERRLQALEETTPQAIRQALDELRPQLEELRQRLTVLSGRATTQGEAIERLSDDQKQLSDNMERVQAGLKALARTVEAEQKRYSTRGLEVEKALDGVRAQLTAVEQMLKTRLADLPQKTHADRDFREAFFQLISGELDVAAGDFAKFRETYADDPRAVDALYRQGQAFFMLRKYDSALVPFLELVEKHPKHRLVVDAKWMLARSLEETGDLKLARDFYTQLIADNTPHKADATRRVYFIDQLYPKAQAKDAAGRQP